MSSTIKPAFLRPVEITNTETIQVKKNAEGASYRTIEITSGVYASMSSVLAAIETAANAGALHDTDGITTTTSLIINSADTELVCRFQFSGSCTLKFYNADMAELFGSSYTDSGAYATSFTMPNRAQFVWVPRYQNANQDYFCPVHKEIFSGIQTKSGSVAGLQTGPVVYYRNMEFVNESASNLYDEAATSTTDTTRNLWYFVKGSLTSYPADADYASSKGFWFFPDWNNADFVPGTTQCGINFDYTSTPDLCAFCQFEETGIKRPPKASAPTGRLYYSVEFEIHTCDDQPTYETGITEGS
jgi:hypothetical protein